jgi:hypothetical protein
MRDLTPAEVTDLLNRHFDLAGRVLQFKRIVDSGQWDQWKQNEPSWFWGIVYDLPIPTRGLALIDDRYGNVVVFPDAAGTLHYTGSVNMGVATQINLPPFQSPTGNTWDQLIQDLMKAGVKVAAAAFVGAIVYALVVKHV